MLGVLINFMVGSPQAPCAARIILREQLYPPSAYEILFKGFLERMLEAVATLVYLATHEPSLRTARLRATAIVGQVLAFLVGRETIVRMLDVTGYSSDETEEICRIILETHAGDDQRAEPLVKGVIGREQNLSMRRDNKLYFAIFLLLIVFTQAGCMVGLDYQTPDLADDVRGRWQLPRGVDVNHFDEKRQPAASWWRQFDDEQLSGLIESFFQENLALAGARERPVELHARYGVVVADKSLQASAALGHTRAQAGDEAISFQGPPPGKSLDIVSAGVAAGWELDLWGRVGRLIEAAREDINAENADYQGMMVSLAAELALTYYEKCTLETRLGLVRQP